MFEALIISAIDRIIEDENCRKALIDRATSDYSLFVRVKKALKLLLEELEEYERDRWSY